MLFRSWTSDSWDRVTVFVSVLFLVRFGKLRAWQDDFPSGEIFVERVAKGPEETPALTAVAAAGVA